MSWGAGDVAFDRPVRWLLAMLGDSIVGFEFAGLRSSNITYGHRFLAPEPLELAHPEQYLEQLAQARVIVDHKQRKRPMQERLLAGAKSVGGTLIEDAFLLTENASLVEDPQVVVGGFDASFLSLPERVVLGVARDHQRYFGMRDKVGKLMPNCIAVVNANQVPDNVRCGMDRVMRARLADAKFFYDEDLKRPLASRRSELEKVTFHKRLGSIGDKVRRIEVLVDHLGAGLGLSEQSLSDAKEAAGLCKCDLVTLMTFEFPELQGEVGSVYAEANGHSPAVARAIEQHYQPKGAKDATAPSVEGALVAVADRLDSLVGCCAINVMLTGSADPLALRRASLGILRTLIANRWSVHLAELVSLAMRGYEGVSLERSYKQVREALSVFFKSRLRGVLTEELPQDVVDAVLDTGADDPYDAWLRATALNKLSAAERRGAGEVLKRALKIAEDAPDGSPAPPASVGQTHLSEEKLFAAFVSLKKQFGEVRSSGDYAEGLKAVSDIAPILNQFFEDVFVMSEDAAVRKNRLRLLRSVSGLCSDLASFNLLASKT